MATAVPDWLARHDGGLREGTDGNSLVVLLGHEPQYLLVPRPAGGQYTCEVMQTNNGRRLEQGSTHPTREEALGAGLDDLRQALGW